MIKYASAMNIDLSAVTHIALSHGHNAHTNGLKYLCENFDFTDVTLIAHPFCFQKKYYGEEYIGSPFSEKEVNDRFHYVPASATLQNMQKK